METDCWDNYKKVGIILFWLMNGLLLIRFPALFTSFAGLEGDKLYLEIWLPLNNYLLQENVTRNIIIACLCISFFDLAIIFRAPDEYNFICWFVRVVLLLLVLWPYFCMAIASFQIFVAAFLEANFSVVPQQN